MKSLKSSSFLSAVKALESSSFLSAVKAIESSSFLSAAKALESSSFLSAAKALESSSFLSAAKTLESSSFLSATKALESSSLLSAINALRDSTRFAPFNELAEIFSSKTVGPLTISEAYQFVSESYLNTSGSSESERLEELSDQVELRVKQAPQGALSKEFYLGLILTLFIFWLSQNSAIQSEEKILLRIDQFQTTISQQLAEMKKYEQVDTFYVVDRAINLRVNSNTKSEVVSILYPNEKVRLIKRKSKWIKVEYFNYAENAYASGWVCKKYLKVLNPKKKQENQTLLAQLNDAYADHPDEEERKISSSMKSKHGKIMEQEPW